MPVVYHCPHCRKPVTVPDPMLGQVLGCPHCRGTFQTLPPQLPVAVPAPPPPPTPAQAFAFDDADRGDDDDETPRRRRYQSASRRGCEPQKVPLSAQLATICAIVGSVVVTMVYRTNRQGGGFDVKQVAIAAVVGGVCAGLGFLVGKLIEGGKADRGNTRRRCGEDDDED